MKLIKWQKLPEDMKNDKVKKYYDILSHKKISLFFKRLFDIVLSFLMLVFLLPFFAVISIIIHIDSDGGVFFKQLRVTQYGKLFYMYKFRTMIVCDDKQKACSVTLMNDSRITKAGNFLRRYRLDELPQLINVLRGEMSFVGTRPEVKKYVDVYTDEMKATLLLPAGVTSIASIKFRNEEEFLCDISFADEVYITKLLPIKMQLNLEELLKFNFIRDLIIIFKTVKEVFKKDSVMVKNEIETTENNTETIEKNEDTDKEKTEEGEAFCEDIETKR